MCRKNWKSWCTSQSLFNSILSFTFSVVIAVGTSSPALALQYDPDDVLLAIDPAKQPVIVETVKTEDKYKQLLASMQPSEVVLWVGGTRRLTVLRFRIKPGKLAEFEQKAKEITGVLAAQRNYYGQFQGSGQQDGTASSPDEPALKVPEVKAIEDPYYPNQWHHGAIHSLAAWQKMGDKVGKTIVFLDSAKFVSGAWGISGIKDPNPDDHGVRVHSIANDPRDGKGGVGVAPQPVSTVSLQAPKVHYWISDDSGTKVTDWRIIEDIGQIMETNAAKMINLSANCIDSDLRYANKTAHPVLHKVFEVYHDQFGGLIFNSAYGGAGPSDSSPVVPYLIVVGGTKQNGSLLKNPGTAAWFVAPAENIWCRNDDGNVSPVTGVSYAAPIVAGIASLVWGASPSLTNVQVEQILKESCTGVSGGGWGLPNAEKAVARALAGAQRSDLRRKSN